MLWLLWRRSADPGVGATCAASLPIAYWGSFYVAAMVPGTEVEDPGHERPRIAGVPSNLLYASVGTLAVALGWYLDRRVRLAPVQ